MQKKGIVVGLATLIPISAYVCILFNLDLVISTLVFLASFMILLIMEIFFPCPQNQDMPFADSNKKILGSLCYLSALPYGSRWLIHKIMNLKF